MKLTPEQAEEARWFGVMANHDAYRSLLADAEIVFDTKGTPLPVSADEAWADDYVRRVRMTHLEQ